MSTQGNIWFKKLIKASILITGAAMTMGNQKCEQKAQGPRTLKKLVELGTIQASPVMFSSSTGFDFKFVANQQIYEVLFNSGDYALKYNSTIAMPPSLATGDTKFFNLTAADNKMMKMLSKSAGKDNYRVEYSQTAWCMVDLAQIKIDGAINSFEMLGGGGLNLGYNQTGTLPGVGGSAGFNVQFAQLDLSMRATRPLTSTILGAVNLTAKETKTQVNFGLNFGGFSIGPSFYYNTPLAKVTKEALSKSVKALANSVKMQQDKWHTRVLANHDTHLMIVGGTNTNLEVGDQLLVYNDNHYWEGEPCNSKYKGGGSLASAAVAKIEIDWVGDEIASGRIIEQNDNNPVIGARVQLYQMHADGYVPPAAGVEQPVSPVVEQAAVTKPGRR